MSSGRRVSWTAASTALRGMSRRLIYRSSGSMASAVAFASLAWRSRRAACWAAAMRSASAARSARSAPRSCRRSLALVCAFSRPASAWAACSAATRSRSIAASRSRAAISFCTRSRSSSFSWRSASQLGLRLGLLRALGGDLRVGLGLDLGLLEAALAGEVLVADHGARHLLGAPRELAGQAAAGGLGGFGVRHVVAPVWVSRPLRGRTGGVPGCVDCGSCLASGPVAMRSAARCWRSSTPRRRPTAA